MKSFYTYHIKISLLLLLLLAMGGCAMNKMAAKKKKDNYTVLGLGDSITEGGPDFFSYLFPLDSLLKQGGQPVHFIGPKLSVLKADTIHHGGYSGKTAEYIAKIIDSIYADFPADIVLLHSGHNHFVEESPVPGIIAAQQKIIWAIKNRNPAAIILVAGVITSGKLPKYAYIPALDTAIKKMVGEWNDPAILFVDQQEHWDWSIHTIQDKVHPNKAGALVIAANWLTAIRKLRLKQN